MSITRGTSAAVASAVTLASAVLVAAAMAPAAVADSHATGSGIAKQRMMMKKDVPAALGKPTSYGFTNRTLDHSIGICEDALGKTVAVAAPAIQASVVIVDKSTPAAPYSDETEFAYLYDGKQSATAAFAEIKAAAASCSGVTTGKQQSSSDTGVTLTTTLSTWVATVTAADAAVAVQESTVYSAPAGSPANGAKTVDYKVFTLTDDAVLVTQHYVNGAAALVPAQVAAVQELAASNTKRWRHTAVA